jgi:hypothetical protein
MNRIINCKQFSTKHEFTIQKTHQVTLFLCKKHKNTIPCYTNYANPYTYYTIRGKHFLILVSTIQISLTVSCLKFSLTIREIASEGKNCRNYFSFLNVHPRFKLHECTINQTLN